MTEKMNLPDKILDAMAGGTMVFGAHKVEDCAVDESGVTLILDTGEKYFRAHSAQERSMYRSDPAFFKELLGSSVTDDDTFVRADTSQYTQI